MVDAQADRSSATGAAAATGTAYKHGQQDSSQSTMPAQAPSRRVTTNG
jgi:hypothetical protein